MVGREQLALAKYTPAADQIIPSWTGFHKSQSHKHPEYTAVSYAPVIEAKPSDMATVFTTMVRCKDMTNALGQTHAIQTFDQQLYAVAQQVKWSMPELFRNHVIRLGGFHEVTCFIASIGKIWGDAGLRDLLVDSDVYAGNSTDQMLAGKQYHRAVRGLTLSYEVMMQALIVQFIKWCEENQRAYMSEQACKNLVEAQEELMVGDISGELVAKISDYVKNEFKPLMEEFCNYGRKSPTFKFWLTFIDTVQVLLWNVRAERDGNWDMHIATQGAMLPTIFVANRTNYARYVPVYVLDMLELPEVVKTEFDRGYFSYREKPGKFNGLWSDMGVEKTIIRDSKSDGGVVGLTRKPAALLRWSVTRHLMGQYAAVVRERSGILNESEESSNSSTASSTKRDEEHVKAMYCHLVTNMTNPFDVQSLPDSLINIATGVYATKDIEKSLLGAVEKGNRQMATFVNGSLDKNGTNSFYNPITRSGLLSFADLAKKTSFRIGKNVTSSYHISPELVFRRALCLAECREDITVESVLSYPIGPVPVSLFHEDMTMRKTNKADLAHKLESETTCVEHLPQFDKSLTVFIRDAMATIQAIKPQPNCTFNDIANNYVSTLVKGFNQADTIIEVFDRYDDPNSTKAAERSRREASKDGSKEYQVIGGRIAPPWAKFLNVTKNKQYLTHFLSTIVESSGNEKLRLNSKRAVVMAGGFENGQETKMITSAGVQKLDDMCSSQEEADTRMLLHTFDANETFKNLGVNGRVVIKSPDTDVLVICVHYFEQLSNISELWIETGRTTNTTNLHRYIPVHGIFGSISLSFCRSLPAIHALTGCDSTSSIFKIGKNTVYKVASKDAHLCQELSCLTFGLEDEALSAARHFFCLLYDQTKKLLPAHANLNSLQAEMSKKKDMDLARLPPCESSFLQHVRRVRWQTRIWESAHISLPDLGNPEDYGWERKNGMLSPIVFNGPTASELLDGLVCNCTKKQKCLTFGKCTCKQSGLPCIELCACFNEESCGNVLSQED